MNTKNGEAVSEPYWQVIDDPFIEVYNELRQVLNYLGFEFPNRKRLDTFRLYTQVQKLRAKLTVDSPVMEALADAYEQALYLLEIITELKRQWLEPESANGYYT